MHKESLIKHGWRTIRAEIESLPKSMRWVDLTKEQKSFHQHGQKLGSLCELIRKISQSEMVEDHIKLMCESLAKIQMTNPNAEQFLSGSHIPVLFEYLKPLPKFVKLVPRYQSHYDAAEEVVKKVAGSDEPKILKKFLKAQFKFLFPRASWKQIFEQIGELKSQVSSRSYTFEMKKLLNKFTHGHAVDFIENKYPKLKDTDILSSKVMQDLKLLCNHIEALWRQKKSNDHLLNFRRSIISCLVTSFSTTQLAEDGWKVNKNLYKRCKRKREDDVKFLDIDPETKAGRKPIDKKLQDEIGQLWLDNSRCAAKCMVTNPSNRAERKPGRRLIMPARHIIIRSDIFQEERASYGTIWAYRLWYVLPPATDDGLCH